MRQIRDIVSSNWQRNLVSPNVRTAERVVIQFTIRRNGSIANESVKQSSGIPSLDRSGLRAIKASRFPPFPGEKPGWWLNSGSSTPGNPE